MTRAETFELTLIPIIGIGAWLSADWLPASLGVGRILSGASALLLFQGLLRDLWLLRQAKQTTASNPAKAARCMCMESTVGVTGVIIGLTVLGLGLDHPIAMRAWSWSVLVITVTVIGFMIKDFVIEGKPLRIRRDKGHVNIVFSWKD